MASKIAALQAKLGGGAMIMGGMRPGAVNPLLKKKKEKSETSNELDNSAVLERPIITTTKPKKKAVREFDELNDENKTDDSESQFNQSIVNTNDENEYKNENENDETETKQNTETETKTNDKWDYDIKGIEDDENKNENDQYDNDKLSVAVESKLKQSSSLVDILMEGPQIVNDNDQKEIENLYEKLENATDSKSLLKKYLTRQIFDKLKSQKTEQGCDLQSCIQSGIDNLDSGTGIYASDSDAYVVFSDLFNPIIMDYHKLDSLDGFAHPKQNFSFDDSFPADLDPDGKFIISTRVRVARNVNGYPLRGGMNEQQTMELEQKLKDILEGFDDEDLKGKYYPLVGMDESTRKQLVEDHFLFKKGDRFLESAGINNFWPNGRGIFFNNNKTFLVWVNEEDQLRIISMEQGANIKAVFNRLEKAVNAINAKLDFAYNEQLGYLTACPTNIGCGERASVHIKVPLTSKNEELFNDIAKRNNLQIRGIHGEHSESSGGIYDVSNKRRLGITEWDGVKDLINGCKELILAESNFQEEENKKIEEKKKIEENKKILENKKNEENKENDNYEIKEEKEEKKEKKQNKKGKKKKKTTDTNEPKKKGKKTTKKTDKKTDKKSDKKTDKKNTKSKTTKSKTTKDTKKKKNDTPNTKSKSKKNSKEKSTKVSKQSKGSKGGGDLKQWMNSNNVFEKQLQMALIANKIDSTEKIKQMDQKKFDQIVRKYRLDRFAKVKKKSEKDKIDKNLLKFEKAWRKIKKGKKKTKKKQKK